MQVTHAGAQTQSYLLLYPLEVFIPGLERLMFWVPKLHTQPTPLNILA